MLLDTLIFDFLCRDTRRTPDQLVVVIVVIKMFSSPSTFTTPRFSLVRLPGGVA